MKGLRESRAPGEGACSDSGQRWGVPRISWEERHWVLVKGFSL